MAKPQLNHTHPAVTLSLRIDEKVRVQLELLSEATGRTKSFLAAEAIKDYLATQLWQITAIKSAVKKADSKNAKFIEHKKVLEWVNSWGNEDEQDITK